MPFPGVPCAMPCGAMPFGGVIRTVIPPVLLLLYVPGTMCVESQKNALTAQLSPAIAQQRSAVRCCVRCPTLPCGAVPCCAVLSFEHTAVPGVMRYPVPTGVYVCRCVLIFSSFFSIRLSVVLSQFLLRPFSFLKITTHTGDRNVTASTNTHNKAQGNQLCV